MEVEEDDEEEEERRANMQRLEALINIVKKELLKQMRDGDEEDDKEIDF